MLQYEIGICATDSYKTVYFSTIYVQITHIYDKTLECSLMNSRLDYCNSLL